MLRYRCFKPPVNWKAVENDLKKAGANQVIHVKARHSIEDWFMQDYSGILKYLRLPQDTPLPPGTGIQKIKSTFKKKNKVYMKGANLQGFIEHLDIDKIIDAISPEIKPLTKALEIDHRRKKQ